MSLVANFQAHPNGFWVTAEFIRSGENFLFGDLVLYPRFSLEAELSVHQENIKMGEYSEIDLVTKYLETKQWCRTNSGRRFENEEDCKEWLESTLTDENIYWNEVIN